MNFQSFLRSWLGAGIVAALWAAVLAYQMGNPIAVGAIVLNSVFAGLLFSILIFALHMPFGKHPSILSSVACGWLFVVLFMLYQHTFDGTALTLAFMAFFGLILGIGAFLGINRLKFRSKA